MRFSPPQTPKFESLKLCMDDGCGAIEVKRDEVRRLFVGRKIDMLALSETRVKEKHEIGFGSVNGKSSADKGRAKEMSLLVSPEKHQARSVLR